MTSFTKHGSRRAIAAEAAGLTDLAEAAVAGGTPVVRLLGRSGTTLETALLTPAPASPAAADELGRRLALTHAYCPDGRRVFGQAPSGLDGDGVMGAAPLSLVPPGAAARTFGEFYAEDRLLPYLRGALANGSIREEGVIRRLAERLREGLFDAPQPRLVATDAALLHGDLWSGNILWARADSSAKGAVGVGGTDSFDDTNDSGGAVAVLIDPACQGGHAESDLAQLTVFGAPYADRVYAAYDEVSPLAEGWRERIGLHRLHILIVHAALFGGAYGRQTVEEARAYL